MARLPIPRPRPPGELPDDRPRTSFTFEGRTIETAEGRSVAAALLAAGEYTLTRSFKLHRRRGYTCGFDACGNCPLTVDGLPGVSSCVTPVRGGEQVRRERGWPTADLDLLATANVMSRFLGAGFQFRHLSGHPRLAHLWERAMAHIAGAGRMPTARAAAGVRARRTVTRRPDVLVVGAGHAGSAAARSAAQAGASTMLVHHDLLGGRALLRGPVVPLSELASTPGLEVVQATVVGRFESGVLPAVSGSMRYDLIPRAVVLATGSYDVPLAFPGNDKPGVILASGVRRLLHLERVRPGTRAVILTEDPDGGELAGELRAAGVTVAAVVRPHEVDQVVGRRRVRAVELGRGRSGRVRCDVVCVDGGERPADELLLQTRYLGAEENTWVVGSAAGWRDGDPRAAAAGRAAADYAVRTRG